MPIKDYGGEEVDILNRGGLATVGLSFFREC
jgi:hypothetical protein